MRSVSKKTLTQVAETFKRRKLNSNKTGEQNEEKTDKKHEEKKDKKQDAKPN